MGGRERGSGRRWGKRRTRDRDVCQPTMLLLRVKRRKKTKRRKTIGGKACRGLRRDCELV